MDTFECTRLPAHSSTRIIFAFAVPSFFPQTNENPSTHPSRGRYNLKLYDRVPFSQHFHSTRLFKTCARCPKNHQHVTIRLLPIAQCCIYTYTLPIPFLLIHFFILITVIILGLLDIIFGPLHSFLNKIPRNTLVFPSTLLTQPTHFKLKGLVLPLLV